MNKLIGALHGIGIFLLVVIIDCLVFVGSVWLAFKFTTFLLG